MENYNFNVSWYLNWNKDTSIYAKPTSEIQETFNNRFTAFQLLRDEIYTIVELNPRFGYNIPCLKAALGEIDYLGFETQPELLEDVLNAPKNFEDHSRITIKQWDITTTNTLPSLPVDMVLINGEPLNTTHQLRLAYKIGTYIYITNTENELVNKAVQEFLIYHPAETLIEGDDTLLFVGNEKTFSISGDIGDTLASLPLLQFAADTGPTDKYNLNFITRPYTREPMTAEKVNGIKELLLQQPYINEVKYDENENAIELDLWRSSAKWSRSIPDSFAEAFNAPYDLHGKPWLTCGRRIVSDVIFARSPRYHTSDIMWEKLYHLYPTAVFVGLKDEHEAMKKLIGDIPYFPTSTISELAEVINGAELVCCNQSAPYWLSAGLQKNTILEIDMRFNNCRVNQKNIIVIDDDNAIILDKPQLLKFW